MTLTSEQTAQIKSQLIQQIESTFPEDKKQFAKQQVESMNDEQLEEFLEKNNLVKNQQGTEKCIFCAIVSGQANSYKIAESEKAIAVLEINPISRGHTIIIPKEHISSSEQIPEQIMDFTKKISEKLKTKLNPIEILTSASNAFGHEIINLIPVYENETSNSPRKKAEPEELEDLQNYLTIKEQPKEEIKEEPINEKNTWLPKRIP